MWLVSGDPKIGQAIEKLEGDSDRAAGIVAAAVVETRLEEAIKRHLKDDPEKLKNDRAVRLGHLAWKSTCILAGDAKRRTTHADTDLQDPRKRYIIAAQVLNYALGSTEPSFNESIII
jgi:hypothetical protein